MLPFLINSIFVNRTVIMNAKKIILQSLTFYEQPLLLLTYSYFWQRS